MHNANESLPVLSLSTRTAAPDALSLSRIGRDHWPALVPLAWAWLSLFKVLSTDWSINSQYSYGWLVPLLALAVFWQRWLSAPAAFPESSGFLPGIFGAVILFGAFPARLVEEANPEWRLILWLHAAGVVGVSWLWFAYVGGRKWARHFAFAIIFPLISVPLPMGLEQGMIQRLTRMVSLIATELANLSGIPALQRGNLIEIGTGILGVEEACSGIRSLQSALLVALFLGEFYRLTTARRVGLVMLGFAAAILGNIGRTYALVYVAARQGLPASQGIHDTVATIAMVATLLFAFILAQWLRPKAARSGTNVAASSSASASPGFAISQVRTMPKWFGVAAISWFVIVSVGVECWYRLHERGTVLNARWSMREPSSVDGFQAVEIPERSRAMLRYSRGYCMTWQDNSGFPWRLYYLRWEAGRNSAQLATAHTPEICLSGAGGKLKERMGEHQFNMNNLQLPFQQYIFDFGGQPLHVFYGVWEDQRATANRSRPAEDGSYHSRLASVLAGKRHLGQTVIEAAVRGPASAGEARELFTKELQRLIVQ